METTACQPKHNQQTKYHVIFYATIPLWPTLRDIKKYQHIYCGSYLKICEIILFEDPFCDKIYCLIPSLN